MTRWRRICFIVLSALTFALAAWAVFADISPQVKPFTIGTLVFLGVCASHLALAPWGDEP